MWLLPVAQPVSGHAAQCVHHGGSKRLLMQQERRDVASSHPPHLGAGPGVMHGERRVWWDVGVVRSRHDDGGLGAARHRQSGDVREHLHRPPPHRVRVRVRAKVRVWVWVRVRGSKRTPSTCRICARAASMRSVRAEGACGVVAAAAAAAAEAEAGEAGEVGEMGEMIGDEVVGGCRSASVSQAVARLSMVSQ